MQRRVLVTGGAGFIGSALVRTLIRQTPHTVLVMDKLTYAGNPDNLAPVASSPRYSFLKADIADEAAMRRAFGEFRPDVVMHLAAESHVDRSIESPSAFLATNIFGTFVLLQAALGHYETLQGRARDAFRFLHVSTDEVFGSLGPEGLFHEETPYAPNSPYAASKASADHFVRAWHHTYGLPTLTTNCSNNYGPYQFPEKLIPLLVLNALRGLPLPIYARGENVRDWLHVDDHAEALILVAERGQPGAAYNIGGRNERRNLDVAKAICEIVDRLAPTLGKPREALITHVADRPGHDQRYALDVEKIERELHWRASRSFESGLRDTVRWYLDNRAWWQRVLSGAYREPAAESGRRLQGQGR